MISSQSIQLITIIIIRYLSGKVLAGRRNVLLDVVPRADLDDHLLGVAQLPRDVHGAGQGDEDVLAAVPLSATLKRFTRLLKPESSSWLENEDVISHRRYGSYFDWACLRFWRDSW